MCTSCLAPLVRYGWNDRVAALYAAIDGDAVHPARVTRVERIGCFVATGHHDHDVFARTTVLPAVGDWVAVSIQGDDVAVTGAVERWSQLARRGPDDALQVMAANVDIVLVTAPADRASLARAEREVLVVWESGARPVVLLTKHDLAEPGLADAFRTRLVGTEVLTESVVTGEGVGAVAELLAPDRTGVLLGPSGAGKSSLVNALLHTEAMATGDVRAGDRRGRHTTTNRHLLVVPSGGVLIDTPGIRSLSLAGDRSGSALDDTFPDIEELAASCRFSDCAHEQEPQCAVRAAVSDGSLDPARLASFRKLAAESAFEERRTDRLARQEHAALWRARAKIGKERTRKR